MDDLANLAQRVYQLERWVSVLAQQSQTNPSRLDNQSLSIDRAHTSLTRITTVHFGRIVDSIPHIHAYKVNVEGLQTSLICCDLAHSSLLSIGAKSIHNYPVGTGVVLIRFPQCDFGIILGAVPDPKILTDSGFADFIVQGNPIGLRYAPIYQYPLYAAPGTGAANWACQRPLDSLNIGEWGAFTETGLGVFLDPFMAYMRVNEATGLFLFYLDQLTRLAGKNLQIRSSGHEQEILNDENELYSYEGFAVYPWENRGFFNLIPSLPQIRRFPPEIQQYYAPFYSRLEPVFDRQIPFHRLMNFRGYLGQGESRFVALPGYYANICGSIEGSMGVFAEHISLTGKYTLRSAKSITLAKTKFIPVPKQIQRPEASYGDTKTNYCFSGLANTSAADTPPVLQDVTFNALYDPYSYDYGDLNACRLLDILAYQFNWEPYHPFTLHKYDWFVIEEAQIPGSELLFVPLFYLLAFNTRMPAPFALPHYVDHRYGHVRYFMSEALLHFADDGSIVLADGYGFELRTSGGNAFISAPGDIWLLPGRNLNTWAGSDIILKARNSADLSATLRDVRIKAERNCMVLAGNSGCGGILLESRADVIASNFDNVIGEDVAFGGVMIVCRKSQFTAFSKHMLLSTNVKKYGDSEMLGESIPPPDTDNGEFIGGPIVIDAGPGQAGSVIFYSKNFIRRAARAVDVFVSGNSYNFNLADFNANYLHGSVYIDGRLLVNESILSKGSIYSGDKVVGNGDSFLKKLENLTNYESIFNVFSSTKDNLDNYANITKTSGRELIEVGKASLAEFSFRNTQQYRTQSLRLYESRWQQLARLTNMTLPTWVEKPVTQLNKPAIDALTYPHPGRTIWTDFDGYHCFTLYNPVLADALYGNKANRGRDPFLGLSIYEMYQANLPASVQFEGNYLVVTPE